MKTNLSIDAAIFLFFLIGFEPALTGNAVHEWLNLAFASAVLVHLLMHWDWVTAMTRRELRTMSRPARLNLSINLLLFAVLVMMILSGLMISRSVFAAVVTPAAGHSVWRGLHSVFGDVLLLLIGLHFALHWKWIAHAGTRCLIARRIIPFTRKLTGVCR